MKIQWDSNLNYQTEAVNSVTGLFEGQNSMLQYFTVSSQSTLDSSTSIGNKIDISYDDIFDNLRKIQSYNKLPLSESLYSLDFDIEMARGTGKTYVYLKTIFELNKKYNFTKFTIVVSNKIQANYVKNIIDDTREHFKGLYDNVIFDYFIFDSLKLEQVRNFAVSSNIEIMIINIDYFNRNFNGSAKKSNIIHREQDKLNGYKPIDLIAQTNPVVIIDEPQLVMRGKGEEAVSYLNPLCTFRYYATHKEIQNLVYKLDAVEAFERGLNKNIEFIDFENPILINFIYIRLLEINRRKSFNSAKIEINANINGNFKRKTVTVKEGFDLSWKKFSNLDIYQGWIIDKINLDEEFISFTNQEVLKIGYSIDEFDELYLKRLKIRKTIEEHLKKELYLKENNVNINVFSVFLIDDSKFVGSDNFIENKYLKIFEEEFTSLIINPEISNLNYLDVESFYTTYHSGDLIDEWTDFKFIFLNIDLIDEFNTGNVFQICNLTNCFNIKPVDKIGIGLPICITREGKRIIDKEINKVTVIDNISSKEFSKMLQMDIEQDNGINFSYSVKRNIFADIAWTNKKGIREPLGLQKSDEIFMYLILMNYINRRGKIQNKLKIAIETGTFNVPLEYKAIKEDILKKLIYVDKL